MFPTEESYSEIQVRVVKHEGEPGVYRAEAHLTGNRFVRGGRFELDGQKLLLSQLDNQAYGLQLFEALFAGDMRDALNEEIGRMQGPPAGCLRIRLWLDEKAPELHALPWERLYQIRRGQVLPLATDSSTPFSRDLPDRTPEESPVTERPIRLLAVYSNPKDLDRLRLPPLDMDQEVATLALALEELARQGAVKPTIMPGRTGLTPEQRSRLEGGGFEIVEGPSEPDRLFEKLKDQHVLHFVGHGHFDEDEGRGVLQLEGADGTLLPFDDSDLLPRLQAMRSRPRLVFLSACETAKRTGGTHPFVGIGPRLVRDGKIPAVVAMQDLVPMETAQELTRHFYGRLVGHGVVDRALNEARNFLFETENANWAIPVLFMRLRGGRLFGTDPVERALESIAGEAKDNFTPLPIEVTRVQIEGTPPDLEVLERRPAPPLELVRAVEGVFRPWWETLTGKGRGLPLPKWLRRRMKAIAEKRGKGQTRKGQSRRLAVLVGAKGTTKTTQLRRIAHDTATAPAERASGTRVLPVHVSLAALSSESPAASSVESLLLTTLGRHWGSSLTVKTLEELDDSYPGITLLALFDGSEELPDRRRRDVWSEIGRLKDAHGRHRYVIAVDSADYDPARLSFATDVLLIRPLSRGLVERFLDRLGEPGKQLNANLQTAELQDLASIPWLLFRMLKLVELGVDVRTRTGVLSGFVDDALAGIKTRRGMRTAAARTLQELAWSMHHNLSRRCSLDAAFEIMAEIRGRRDYSLGELLDELVDVDLLVRLGSDEVRFTHGPVQDLCCARALTAMAEDRRERVLDEITATLGRPTRLRAWRGVLILLGGLASDPEVALRKLLYGAALSGGEQVYLAAHFLRETLNSESGARIDSSLQDQVTEALVWRLGSGFERRTEERARAAQMLGRLALPTKGRATSAQRRLRAKAIEALARTANQKVRLDWRGELSYDLSSVRMTAARALLDAVPARSWRVLGEDEELIQLVRWWHRKDVERLTEWMSSGPEGSRPLPVFALADLLSENDDRPLEALVGAFMAPTTDAQTRWAVTDALALVEQETLKSHVVYPLIGDERPETVPAATWKKRQMLYDRLAYLIGTTGIQDSLTSAFLAKKLVDDKRVKVKARVIQAYGEVGGEPQKKLLERIVAGHLDDLELSETTDYDDRLYLRIKALEALGSIGDRDSLARIRKQREDWHPALDRTLFWASEDIAWREGLAAGGR